MISNLFKSKISKYVTIFLILLLMVVICLSVLFVNRIIPIPVKCVAHSEDVNFCFPIFTPHFWWPYIGKETWYKKLGDPTYPRNR